MGAAAAGAAGAILRAIKASGVLVRVAPDEFSRILTRARDPLVVVAEGGLFRTKYRYLLGYKGLAFYTRSNAPLTLPPEAEVVKAGGIWIPDEL